MDPDVTLLTILLAVIALDVDPATVKSEKRWIFSLDCYCYVFLLLQVKVYIK